MPKGSLMPLSLQRGWQGPLGAGVFPEGTWLGSSQPVPYCTHLEMSEGHSLVLGGMV